MAAHGQLDRAVDAVFNRTKRKWTDAERQGVLLKLYSDSRAEGELPMPTAARVSRRRRSAASG